MWAMEWMRTGTRSTTRTRHPNRRKRMTRRPSKRRTRELVFDYVDSAPTSEGTVHIVARYAQGLRRPVIQFLTIEPAPPSADAGPPPLAIAPIEMTRSQARAPR